MFSSQHLPIAIVGSLLIVAGSLGCSGPSEVTGPGPFSAVTDAEFACVGATVGESSGRPPTLLGKFGAEFQGVSFGRGTSPANTLRKKVPVAFAQSTPDFSLGEAWIFRSSAETEGFFDYTINVTYWGNEPHWYAKFESVRFIDANGQVLATDIGYLNNVSGSSVSLRRLAQGETAQAMGSTGSGAIPIYSQVAALEVGTVDPGVPSVNPGVKASVAATDLCKTNNGFAVSLVNRGAAGAGVSDLHQYLLSDGEGPVGAGFARRLLPLPLSKLAAIKPNERSILSEETVPYDGRADRAVIFTDYMDDFGPSSFNVELPPQAAFSTASNAALQTRKQAAQDFMREKFRLWAERVGRTHLQP